jgi:tetratricopeptide (TPR) repeat protein
MEGPKEEFSEKESPKEESPKEESLKEEVAKSGTPEQEAPKKQGRRRRWRFEYTIIILASVLGAMLTIYWPKVVKFFECSNQTNPLSPQQEERFVRAVSLSKGAPSEALKMLEELILERPDYVYFYNARGIIYVDILKQYHNAEKEFERGLKRDSKNKSMLRNLGLAYYYLGDFKQAIYWNQKALDQDPDLIIAIYDQALYYVDYGEQCNDTSYYNEAIRLYEIVINRGQEFTAAAMFNLAALYARFARNENIKSTRDQYIKKAVELLDKAIEKEGHERLRKVTGEIPVQYGNDLRILYPDSTYNTMIEKWKDRFTN